VGSKVVKQVDQWGGGGGGPVFEDLGKHRGLCVLFGFVFLGCLGFFGCVCFWFCFCFGIPRTLSVDDSGE